MVTKVTIWLLKKKNVKKRLGELTGESYSSANYDEDATLFYPTRVEEVEAEDSIPDYSIYQLGSEEDFNAPYLKITISLNWLTSRKKLLCIRV